ncbi:diguanylate cyclase [Cupriavidus sp. CV2]|uniref:sensor domain-containing diguanylate cyclase n=1 Tax=Cupriavidus ulmosensis TaxID=3065913 RepID=UPI00296AD124|nr:diguanylate cyclase [Cupriavidus sp. CV2]MDW3687886.1 diguanylate cyclase [Cupriavidus sp. CV2]
MRWTLKNRAALATALVVSLFSVALAAIAQYYAYTSLKELLQAQQYTQVKLVAEQLNEKFEGRAVLLRTLARQLAPMLERSPEELKAFASQAASIPEAFNSVSLIWPDGRLAFNTAMPTGQQFQLADRDYVQGIVQGASTFFSEPLIGRNNGAPGFVIAVALRSPDGRLRAIVIGSLNLLRDNFLLDVVRDRVGATGMFCLVSSGQNPRYVMHADRAQLMKIASAVGESCGTEKAYSPFEILQPTQPIVARYLLKSNGWELVATLPAKEAYSPLTEVRRKVVLAAGIGLLVAVGLMWIVVRHLLVPLERLHRAIQRNPANLNELLPKADTPRDEVSELTITFSRVIRQLVERESALQKAKEEAHASERRIQTIANQVPDLISYVDAQGRYVFVNTAYERRFGLPAASIVGLSMQELWGAPAYAEMKPYLDRAYAGESLTFDRVPRDTREYQCLEITYQPALVEGCDIVQGLHVFVRDVTVERAQVNRLEQLTLADHLTGLLNRKGFDRYLSAAIKRADQNQSSMALLLVDLDGFKCVNDSYGHAVGDKLLVTFAERLALIVPQAGATARIGGDEFAVVLDNVKSSDEAERVAQAIMEFSAHPYIYPGYQVTARASVGIALRRRDSGRVAAGQTAAELFSRADAALYGAKHDGKGRFLVCEAEVD